MYMKKNPILRSMDLGCGDIWSEIDENVDIIENVSGGSESTAMLTLSIYVGYEKLSQKMGNKGSICTATVECQNNCRG